MCMKTKTQTLSRSYLAALGKHLKAGAAPGLKAARRLGMQAVGQGLETLDLAKIHEEAIIILVLPHHSTRAGARMIRRAGAFFAEAITPIERVEEADIDPEDAGALGH